MRTITIRQLQRNLYQELEDLPVIVTRRIVTKDHKHKVINLCVVLPFIEDNQSIIEGLFDELTEEERAYVDEKNSSHGLDGISEPADLADREAVPESLPVSESIPEGDFVMEYKPHNIEQQTSNTAAVPHFSHTEPSTVEQTVTEDTIETTTNQPEHEMPQAEQAGEEPAEQSSGGLFGKLFGKK
jgi:hypothetical protein